MSAVEKFSDRLRRVLIIAQGECLDLGQERLKVDHLVAALAVEGHSIGGQALGSLGLDGDTARTLLELRTGRGSIVAPPVRGPEAQLATIGIDLAAAQQAMVDSFGAAAVAAAQLQMAKRRRGLPRPTARPRAGATPFSDVAKAVLEEMVWEMDRRGDAHLGPEHLAIAIDHVDSGPASFLAAAGIAPTALAAAVNARLPAPYERLHGTS